MEILHFGELQFSQVLDTNNVSCCIVSINIFTDLRVGSKFRESQNIHQHVLPESYIKNILFMGNPSTAHKISKTSFGYNQVTLQ